MIPDTPLSQNAPFLGGALQDPPFGDHKLVALWWCGEPSGGDPKFPPIHHHQYPIVPRAHHPLTFTNWAETMCHTLTNPRSQLLTM